MRRLGTVVAAGAVSILALAVTTRAGDKSTLFDLDKDLQAFFDLQSRIMATDPRDGDTPADRQKKLETRQALFKKHGIRDEKHWDKESHAGMGYSYTKRAQRIYGGEHRILDMRRAAGEGKTLRQYVNDRMDSEERTEKALEQLKVLHDESKLDPALLTPVDGVSLEKYAAISNAATFHESNFAAVTKETGMTEAKYGRVSEQWTERMRVDLTRLVMKKYGAYFMSAARGRYATAGKNLGQAMLTDQALPGPEPVTMEKWVEITEFYGSRAGEIKGSEDVTRILKPYGLTFYEWNIISNWWGHKRTEALKGSDPQFLRTWSELREKYRRQFAANAK